VPGANTPHGPQFGDWLLPGKLPGRPTVPWTPAICTNDWLAAAGAGNDFQKDKQFKKLNAVKDTIEVKVIRAGNEVLVSNLEVVVGDLLVLDTGDKIVADGVAVESFGLVVDEASLTGESEPLAKGPKEDPWCRSGTQVTNPTL
jgi:Ca2+-transporting ATPase